MSTITNLQRLCVYACRMRETNIEIIYGDDHRRPPIIVNADTREVLRWKLSKQEQADLAATITGHYQLKGTRG